MKNFLWLKAICFILAPILVFMLVCSTVYIIYTCDNPDNRSIVENNNYFESNIFSDSYKNNLTSIIGSTYNRVNFSKKINDINYITYENYDKNFNYVYIDKNTNEIYTNLTPTEKTDTFFEIREQISSNKYYWNYYGEVDTNINNLSKENIPYTDYLYECINSKNFEIYSSINDNLKFGDAFVLGNITFTVMNKTGNLPMILILPICLILLILICIYLILSLGHKKGHEGIYLNILDKMPLEVLFIILLIVGGAFGVVSVTGPTLVDTVLTAVGIFLFFIDFYICFAIGVSTIIKRIKSRTLIRNTFIYEFFKWIKKIFKKFTNWLHKNWDLLFTNTNSTLKLALIYFGFILGSIILWAITKNGVLVLLVPIIWICLFIFLLKKINTFYKIKSAVHSIYEGKNDIKLDETEFTGDFVEFASDVNDIAGGFSNAIAESLKSERLKTELITNVSHDIKTPLTSIISYVDLLKQEDIKDEKIKEYITVLDNKSERLKKLIEDLVEASKASSGNIKLTKENLNVAELINQCVGEFEDKFKTHGLEIIFNTPKENVIINADNRYMYRVIENIFSNITKYALENSRVYIDVTKSNNRINISIKNISKNKLNISPDELIQRFVRGDKSRFTEGSGLGLSISRSLTELQDGEFNISIDGDLFKVNLSFNAI